MQCDFWGIRGTEVNVVWNEIASLGEMHACNNMENRGIYLVTVYSILSKLVNTLKTEFTDKILYQVPFLSHFTAVKNEKCV